MEIWALIVKSNTFNFLIMVIIMIAVLKGIHIGQLLENAKTKIKEKLNKEINITYTLDKSVIAGLIYKIGDNVIDTSLAHKMEKFKKEIIK